MADKSDSLLFPSQAHFAQWLAGCGPGTGQVTIHVRDLNDFA